MAGTQPAGSEMVLSFHSDNPIVYHEPLGEILAQLYAPLFLPNQELPLALSEVRTLRSLCAEGAELTFPFPLGRLPQGSFRIGALDWVIWAHLRVAPPLSGFPRPTRSVSYARTLGGWNSCKPSTRCQTRATTSDSRYLPRLSVEGLTTPLLLRKGRSLTPP